MPDAFGRTFGAPLAIGVLLVLLAPLATMGDTYYVSPSGSDSNPGTLGTPWATIAKANATLIAGDTVLIHAGTYSDQIRPANNGASDSMRITYRAYGDGDAIVTIRSGISFYRPNAGAIALGDRSYITVDGIKVLPGWSPMWPCFGNMAGSDHCIVENCVMEGSISRGFVMADWLADGNLGRAFESRYNIFRNNTVTGVVETEDLVTLGCNSHHNLVEDNILFEAGHVVLNVFPGSYDNPHHNVIRNNRMRTTDHTAMSFYRVGPGNIYEGNLSDSSYRGNSLQFSQPEAIIRYNVISRGGYTSGAMTGGVSMSTSTKLHRIGIATDNRFYNNTIIDNNGYGFGAAWNTDAVDIGRNVHVNNIVYANNIGRGAQIKYRTTRSVPGGIRDLWRTNLIGEPSGGGNPVPDPNRTIVQVPYWGFVTPAEAMTLLTWPVDPVFENILQLDPCFVDFNAKDYHLNPDSSLIDAGTHLTTVDGADSGSGTTLKVDDSRFFSDGMGVPEVEADWIAIGDIGNTIQIVSVDHATNTITLSASFPRSVGDPVWLHKISDGTRVLVGNAPDLGAFEHDALLWSNVEAAYVFYNNSRWDGSKATMSPNDDNAIATDKEPLFTGQTATFANYTSYSRGINGVMIDIARLAGTPTTSDFEFYVGNNGQPWTWTPGPVPQSITVRAGAGVGGSDRVTIIWTDNAIEKEWLEVTVLATANTGLQEADVFYFGNAIGDTGNNPNNTYVNASDRLKVRANRKIVLVLDPAFIDDVCDFNRDKNVNASDRLIARANPTHFLNALNLITIYGDSTVTVLATDPDAIEGPPDPGVFTVSRGADTGGDLIVNYTVGGSAAEGSDFETLGGSVTIPDGASTGTVTVTPINDAEKEGDETVTLTLSGGDGYVVGSPDRGTVTIADDDSRVTYSFDDISGSGTAVNGVHAGIDFGTGKWMSDASFAGLTRCGRFATFTTLSTFSLPSGAILKSITVSGTTGGSYKIMDGVNADILGSAPATPQVVTTGWTTPASTITLSFSHRSDTAIDDIAYEE